MSYCRFSSMNFMCDVYVYEDVYGGWTTHVAGRRAIFPTIPALPRWMYINFGQKWNRESSSAVYPNVVARSIGFVWYTPLGAYDRIRYWMLDRIPRRDIGLLHDGERFNHATPQECASFLCELRAMGYRVPQYAIDALNAEEPQ